MRQWNNELNRYAEYKKLCAEREEKPAYQTLGSFRRAYRSEEESLSYAKSHYARRDANEYNEFEKVIGKANMPKTLADFQELKYNKDKSSDYERLKQEKKQEKDYLTAASGGKHYGKLKNFIKKYNDKQLQKSIKSYNATIEEHKQKIADPRSVYPNWDSFDEREKAGYLRKWENDIQRNEEERNIAIGLLKRRQNDEN